jgi:hypothetical protein
LAHDAALLGIGIDTYTLFTAENSEYELWLATLVEKVNATHRAQQRQKQQQG